MLESDIVRVWNSDRLFNFPTCIRLVVSNSCFTRQKNTNKLIQVQKIITTKLLVNPPIYSPSITSSKHSLQPKNNEDSI